MAGKNSFGQVGNLEDAVKQSRRGVAIQLAEKHRFLWHLGNHQLRMKRKYHYTKVGSMPVQSSPIAAGQPAPDFSLQDAKGETISLSDYSGQKVIVYFYPKAATPGCTTEACDFRDNLNSLKAAGYSVLGISPDAPEELAAFANDESLNFPLLSDPGNEVAAAYGSYGEKTIGGKTIVGTLRSTAVINEDGSIQQIEYSVDATGHVARLRDSLGI